MTEDGRDASQFGQCRSLRGRTAARVMLMRYAAVTLLTAVLTASAVRAQSPAPKPPPSRPEGQGWVEVPVKPQPGAPLRLSAQVSRVADARWPSADYGGFRFRTSIKNISHRDIGFFTTRNEAAGDDRRAGRPGGHSRLPGFYAPGKALRPGQVDVVESTARLLPSSWVSRLTVEVESVVFMDGTVWCTGECRLAQYEAGKLAAGRAAVGRLLKVLKQRGLDAVVNALREKVAEDDPVPAVVVSTGELVDIKPPPGHTKEWEYGFLETTKFVADTLWVQYVHHGTGNIERTLRDAYRVEGMNDSRKEQGRVEKVPVKPRPGSPLRLSVKAHWLRDSGFIGLKASVKNVGNRDIGTYSIRRVAVGDERPGNRGWGGRLPDFSWPGKVLRPGQMDEQVNVGAPLPSSDLPRLTVEVESVVFMDGTIWCADVCHGAESLAGRFAGGRAAVGRLLKVLEQRGLDAVITALKEKVAEDDPVPAVVVSTGELVDIKPPPGHTPDWERGFRDATKSVADTLWVQYVHQGTGNIERMLRDAYRVEAAK